jgi:hypothetical protein
LLVPVAPLRDEPDEPLAELVDPDDESDFEPPDFAPSDFELSDFELSDFELSDFAASDLAAVEAFASALLSVR